MTLIIIMHIMHMYIVVWFMSQSVHWPNGKDYGTPVEGAQEDINIRDHSPVSGSKACSSPNA